MTNFRVFTGHIVILNLFSPKIFVPIYCYHIYPQCGFEPTIVSDIQLTLSISNSQGTRKFFRDRERKIGYSLYKGTETLVRDRERFEIEGVRDTESQLYYFGIFQSNGCALITKKDHDLHTVVRLDF